MRSLGIALLWVAMSAPLSAAADGFPVKDGRYAGGAATVLRLNAEQRVAIDKERKLVLTNTQQAELAREAGTSAREFLVYDLRLEESDCTCHAANVAFRFSDEDVEIAHAYLMTDAEAARRRAEEED